MVFFFANMWPKDMTRGITKKIFAEMRAMEKCGHKVAYYTGYEDEFAGVYNSEGKLVYKLKFPSKNATINRLIRSFVLKEAAYRFLKKWPKDIDILYSRYLFFDFKAYKLFKHCKRNRADVFLELHAYPLFFAKRISKYPIYLLDLLTRPLCLKNIDKIVAISDLKRIFGRKVINIDNGIDLDNISPIEHIDDGIFRIISVSYEWEVNGYDRLVKGLNDYYKMHKNPRKVHLVFVGTVMNSTKELIEKYNMGEFVELPGVLSGAELDAVYNRCNIGAGCLAIHRQTKNAISDLKTREYIAKGIPFIYAGKSFYEIDKFPYALGVDDNDEPVNINEVIKFYDWNCQEMCSRRIPKILDRQESGGVMRDLF